MRRRWRTSCRSTPQVQHISFNDKGFTLIELLIAIGIIALLMGLLIGVVGLVREHARSAGCLSNLRQIGQAILTYAQDHRNVILPADLRHPDFNNVGVRLGNWATILVTGKYLAAPDHPDPETSLPAQSVFRCPAGADQDGFVVDAYTAPRDSEAQGAYWNRQAMILSADGSLQPGITIQTWYGINGDLFGEEYPTFRFPSDNNRTALHTFSEIKSSSDLALVYDGFFHHDRHRNLLGHARHKRKTVTNYLFADGHAAEVKTAELPASLADADLEAASYPKFKLRQR